MYFDLRLWQFTRGVRGHILATVAVGVAASALGILRLALLGWLIGRVFQGASLGELAAPAAGVAAAMLLRGVLEHARAMMAHATAARVQRHLRRVLYDKIVTLGPAWFGRQRTGAVIAAVIDGVEQLETYFGQYLPQLAVATIMPLAVFLAVLLLDGWMAATLLAFALVALLAPQGFHRWDRRNSLRRSKAYKAFAAEFLDSVQGLATLKAFGQSGERLRSLTEKAHELFRSTMWVMATNAASRGIADTAIALGAAAVLAVGAWRVEAGLLDLTALLMVLMVGVEAFRPMRDLRALMHQGMVAQASAQAVFELLDGDAPVKATARADALPVEPTIAFEDVQFTYPGGRGPAHRGLDFRVAAGERVGIVGASGSGKSSIVKLLLRLYDPDSGAVRIGGRDLRDMGFDQVRGLLAVVGQDSYLFHGTVEDNLRLGRPDATPQELEDAARAANAHEFIRRLPQGYRTVVGERGIRLSGGQRQRIAIARALLRDAPILVLDEALSAVDAANEAVIQDALDRLMRGRTTIVCAHRLSSVIGCDRILVLDGGRVAESGNHAELMQAGGVYRRLMAAQAEEGAGAAPILAGDEAESAEDMRPGAVDRAELEPADSILRAEGLGWGGAIRSLMAHVRPWRAKLAGTFLFGVARVLAFTGVGVAGALAVAAVKRGEPFEPYLWWLFLLAPAAGLLHWLESWMAHDTAFRMLTEMRIRLFAKLDVLAPAYLLRRRTGVLVGLGSSDVES
ncbi:MAG: ATP-binding cassette domain-containing protein, partial [Alphaproteobacteria bacterium]